MDRKFELLFEEISKNTIYQKQYREDPIRFLQDHGINTDDLPKEYLDKIAAGCINFNFFPNIDNSTSNTTLNNSADNSTNTILINSESKPKP